MAKDPTVQPSGLFLRPVAPAAAHAVAPGSLPLAGGPLHFASCEVIRRAAPGKIVRQVVPLSQLTAGLDDRDAKRAESLLARLSAARAPFAGIPMDRPRVMAVINVTPDSFSDGGDRLDSARAVEDGLAMMGAGADLLDVGGESTRPGADPVALEEELRRVVPVVRELAAQGAVVSIDTRRAQVMAEALDAGAALVNDVTALAGDPESLPLVARAGVPAVLMHMQGEPGTMQSNPRYDDAALDIFEFLDTRLSACEAHGIPRERLAIDPGIGFGKTLDHNIALLDQLALYHGLGCPQVLGVSRKSFIGRLSGSPEPKERMPGSLAAALAGIDRGVQIVRVHDVAETVQALEVWRAITVQETGPDAAAQ